jgi:hypothetical protein
MAFTKKTIFGESIGDQTQYCKLADYRLRTICTQLEKSILNSTKEFEGKEDVDIICNQQAYSIESGLLWIPRKLFFL